METEISLKERALAGLPAEWREKLIEQGAVTGIKHDNDIGWLLVGSVIDSAAAAFAAGQAADAVQVSIDKIPDKVFQGALSAGRDINAAFKKNFGEYGQALSVVVDKARDTAKTQISTAISTATGDAEKKIKDAGKEVKDAAATLETLLNDVIVEKAQKGVTEWATAASKAANAAAKAASGGIYAKAVYLALSGLLLSGLFGIGVTAFFVHESGQWAPAPVVQTPSGHRLCFPYQGRAFCELTMNAKQQKSLYYKAPKNFGN